MAAGAPSTMSSSGTSTDGSWEQPALIKACNHCGDSPQNQTLNLCPMCGGALVFIVPNTAQQGRSVGALGSLVPARLASGFSLYEQGRKHTIAPQQMPTFGNPTLNPVTASGDQAVLDPTMSMETDTSALDPTASMQSDVSMSTETATAGVPLLPHPLGGVPVLDRLVTQGGMVAGGSNANSPYATAYVPTDGGMTAVPSGLPPILQARPAQYFVGTPPPSRSTSQSSQSSQPVVAAPMFMGSAAGAPASSRNDLDSFINSRSVSPATKRSASPGIHLGAPRKIQQLMEEHEAELKTIQFAAKAEFGTMKK